MNLIGIFDALSLPATAAGKYTAQPIKGFDAYRIGKTKEGLPILLIKVTSSGDEKIGNVSLRNISVLHDLECSIEVKGKKSVKDRFTVIQCNINERAIHEGFLEIIELLIISVGNSPNSKDIDDFIYKVLEIFRRIVEPPIKTVQGLWAELFLIAVSPKPKNLLKNWHFDTKDKYDFSSGKERIEVKSYSLPYRTHNFSIEQLNPPYNSDLLIASINTVRSHSGVSIDDLRSKIQGKIKSDLTLIESLRLKIMYALGKDYKDSLSVKFDNEVALTSLKYFKHDDVPKILSDEIPKLIFDVKFKVDLSSIKNTPPNKLKSPGELYSAIK